MSDLTDDERETLYGNALGLDNLHAAWGRETLESAVERILAARLDRLTSERDMALRMHAVQFARANFRAEDLQRLRDGLTALMQNNAALMANNPSAAAYTGIGNAALQDLLDAQ